MGLQRKREYLVKGMQIFKTAYLDENANTNGIEKLLYCKSKIIQFFEWNSIGSTARYDYTRIIVSRFKHENDLNDSFEWQNTPARENAIQN